MEKIRVKEIDLSNLTKLENTGTWGSLFTDNIFVYKFLVDFNLEERKNLEKKFLEMDGISIDGVLMPKSLIVDNNILYGYTMDSFNYSNQLSSKFLNRYFNCKDLFFYVYKASKILREIHKNGIIYQDLSFENILVDRDERVAFCDIDSCMYKNYSSQFFSVLFKKFLIDYRKEKLRNYEDIDKISMILSFYNLIYMEELNKISKRHYEMLSKNIHTLENLRECFDMLVNRKSTICNIPYLDEVIDFSDDFVIDREKYLTFKQRFLLWR